MTSTSVPELQSCDKESNDKSEISKNDDEKMSSDVEQNNCTEKNNNRRRDKKKYLCTVPGCNASFPRPFKLKLHMNVHNEERPFKCIFDGCDNSYTNPSHLKRHQQTHKMMSINYKCKICSAQISTASNLKRHYKRAHNKEREMYCHECEIRFSKKNRFEEHMAAHKNFSMYKCDKCDIRFPTHIKLKKHQQKYNKSYKCPVENCSEIFDKWAALISHQKNAHSKEHCCPECGKVFLTQRTLKSHHKIHTDDGIPCPYENCNRTYSYKRNLSQHIRSVHIGNKFHCDLCNKVLVTKQKMEHHMITMHLSEKKPTKSIAKGPNRLERIDKGLPKKSALSKLTGIQLSVHAEMKLIDRVPTALLRDKAVEDVSSFSEDDRASDFSVQGG